MYGLKTALASNEDTIHNIESEKEQKDSQIQELERLVLEIRNDLSSTRTHADDLQRELETLQAENQRLAKIKLTRAKRNISMP